VAWRRASRFFSCPTRLASSVTQLALDYIGIAAVAQVVQQQDGELNLAAD
jgi:hypothetical protein